MVLRCVPLSLALVFFCLFFSEGTQAQPGSAVELFAGSLPASENRRRVLSVTAADGTLTRYRLAELEALPLYETRLPALYEGEGGRYQGVLLDDVLRKAGIETYQRARLSALDGYVIEFTHVALEGSKGFLATRFETEEMPIEKKGFLRLLLPHEADWQNPANTNTSTWIWNLHEIQVLE